MGLFFFWRLSLDFVCVFLRYFELDENSAPKGLLNRLFYMFIIHRIQSIWLVTRVKCGFEPCARDRVRRLVSRVLTDNVPGTECWTCKPAMRTRLDPVEFFQGYSKGEIVIITALGGSITYFRTVLEGII